MATQRYISTSFWDDPWLHSLSFRERYLYMYLLTSPSTNIAGIYKISSDRIEYDTGLPSIEKIFQVFSDVRKAFHLGQEWVVIPAWPQHQKVTERNNIKIGIDRILTDLPDDVWDFVLQCGYRYKFLADHPRYLENPKPLRAPSSPSNYPNLDSSLDLDRDSNLDRDIHTQNSEAPSSPSKPLEAPSDEDWPDDGEPDFPAMKKKIKGEK